MHHYDFILIFVGILVLLAAWIPLFVAGTFVSLPMIAVAIGYLVGAMGWLEGPWTTYGQTAQVIAGFALLVAVLGAGLRIDRRFSTRRWGSAWRLLLIVMPLSVALIAALGVWLLGLPLGVAVILAAILAPTDPVLAAAVQTGHPGAGEDGEAKFALTAEAGLNDGLALPFLWLGIALLAAPSTQSLTRWAIVDGVWNVAGGAAVGVCVGVGLVAINRLFPERWWLRNSHSGIVAVALALIAYGCAEAAGANGLVAVFCEAVAARNMRSSLEYSRELSETAEQLERAGMTLLMVLFGASLGNGLLSHIGWTEILFAGLIFALRPLGVLLAFLGSKHPPKVRIALSYFGIRGIASLYYVGYLYHDVHLDLDQDVLAVTGLVVLISVVLFGTTTETVARSLLGHPPDEEP